MAPHFIVFTSIRNLIPLRANFMGQMRERAWPPPNAPPGSDPDRGRDLVKRRIANLKRADLRRALDYLAQGLYHFLIVAAAITVCIMFFIQQADHAIFLTAWGVELKLVL